MVIIKGFEGWDFMEDICENLDFLNERKIFFLRKIIIFWNI